MLSVKQLSVSYGKKEVLRDLNFELTAGQSVCLLGKNGVGKSTLFKTLLGLYPATSGQILLKGQALESLSRKEIAKQLSYIPQTKLSNHQFTVFEMVLMGRTAQLQAFQQPRQSDERLVESALDLLNIRSLSQRIFSQLSGGEQQLVIIARSVVQESRIFIMDEPCANLDYSNQLMVLKMIRRLTEEGYLIIQATHDPNHALQYANHVMLLQGGQLVAQGQPAEVLTSQCLSDLYQSPIEVYAVSDQRQFCLPSQNSWEVMADVAAV